MKTETTINTHKSVGPYIGLYDHGLVVFIQELEKDEDRSSGKKITESLWVCLDCGWTDTDKRTFAHEECNRKNNEVNTTVRERGEETIEFECPDCGRNCGLIVSYTLGRVEECPCGYTAE